MTDLEEQELRDLAGEITGALHSTWEPACLARAFATPPRASIALTMQGWIDLDHLRSPLLLGRPFLALDDDAIMKTAEVFGLSFDDLNAEDIARCAIAIERAVADAFALGLEMRAPGGDAAAAADDGFGAWLPVFAFLVAQCRIAPAEAMALRVDQAFALMAAVRRNQGWSVAGLPYALRDLEGGER